MPLTRSILLAALLAPGIASADPALRCGGALIEAGTETTDQTVLEKCGEPDSRDGNRWVYAKRSGGKTVVVHFEGGKVTAIEEQLD